MTITIHRGIAQIGGCITEIRSRKGTKVLIDLGHNLPEGEEQHNDPLERPENIDPILGGVNAVFYTHSHGDHLGFEAHVHDKGIPQYIGGLAKSLLLQLRENTLFYSQRDGKPDEAVERSHNAISNFIEYSVNQPVTIDDITITPYYVSHSAPDAYMFLIECDGLRLLHTGDFRDHGYLGKGLIPTIKKYIAQQRVDVLITEGTMLGRDDSRMISERDLSKEAVDLANKYKYLFVMCSSQNADRILSFHNAAKQTGRHLLVDGYQYTVLKVIQEANNTKRKSIYNFYNMLCYHKYWDTVLSQDCHKGFVMLVRNNRWFNIDLDKIMACIDITQCCLVYSQYIGYITEGHSAFNQRTLNFVKSRDWHVEQLHTSGHASRETLAEVCKTTNPRLAIIPIHRDARSDFRSLDIPQELKERVVTESTTIENVEIIVK